MSTVPPTPEERPRPFRVDTFFFALAALQVLRIVIGLVAFPLPLVMPLTIVTTAIFVAVPIWAVVKAADNPWTPKRALLFIAVGVPVQVLLTLAAKTVLHGFPAFLVMSAAQLALFTWCVGLGALLATLVKDKNLFIPITICLALLDVYLIFAPNSITKVIMEKAPEVLQSVGASIPKIQTEVTSAPVGQFATIGPADFVFLGMLFIALFRFNLRTRKTLLVLVPVVLAYLVLAAVFGAVPLLPPIVLTVLFVNIREFKLTKEEWASTALVSVIFLGLLVYGLTRPRPVEVIRVPAEGESKTGRERETRGKQENPNSQRPQESEHPPLPLRERGRG